jgi:PPE-repeat protein
MSFVTVVPEMVTDAATDLASIGSAISAAHAAAAAPTTGVLAAASDEVSSAIAGVFGSYGQEYQALSALAGRFHDQFVHALNTGAGAYTATEAAAAQLTSPAQFFDYFAGAFFNVGFGNIGIGNVGFFNNGTGNVGISNVGSNNVGIGNVGNNNIGEYLTGNNQIGIGSMVIRQMSMPG